MSPSRCAPPLLLAMLLAAAAAADCPAPALGCVPPDANASKRAATPPIWAAGGNSGDGDSAEGEVSTETLLAVMDMEETEDASSTNILKGSIFESLPVFSLANSKINNSECVVHSRIFLHELRMYKMWAMQMFDAGAKLGSGVLRGAASQLGDFDSCLAVSARLGPATPAPPPRRLRGRYCLLAVDVEALPGRDGPDLSAAVSRALIHRTLRSSRHDPSHFVPRASTLYWAVCVPASCTPDDVDRAAEEALAPYNGSTSGLGIWARAEPHQCYVRPEEGAGGLPASAVITASALVAVAVVAALATLRDVLGTAKPEDTGNGWRAVQAFSLFHTSRELTRSISPDSNILCICGLRALLAIVLYIAHAIIPLARTPYTNRVEFLEQLSTPISVALRTASNCTDSFLLMSGALAAYTLTREVEKTGNIRWFKWIIGRYIRLTPALLAFVLLSAYIMDHLGEGPMWGEVITQNSQLCQKYGWRNLLYMQNFFAFEDMCGPHTHHLAIDMQLSFFLPLMIYFLHINTLLGTGILLSINAVSTWLRFTRTMEYNLSMVIYHGVTPSKLYRTANIIYGLPLPRASAYILGVLLGYALQKMKKSPKFPKVFVASGWIVATLLATCSMLLAKDVYKLNYVYSASEAAHFSTWGPLAWSCAFGWLIFACHTGYAGKLNKILSLKPLVFLSRISYSLYMMQFPVFFYSTGTNRSSKTFGVLSSFFPLQQVTVVLITSAIFTVLFDLPMQQIKSLLLGSSPTRDKVQHTKEKFS